MALSLAARKNGVAINSMYKQFVRTAVYNNYEWRPGPYPKTEAERRAAAKKYNMVYDDYEPFPDDGMGHGDYPMLEPVSAEARDPHGLYDNPAFKRNYNEVIDYDADTYDETRFNVNTKLPYPYKYYFFSFVGLVAACFGVYFLTESIQVDSIKRLPPHEPRDGKKHYSFELVPKGSQ